MTYSIVILSRDPLNAGRCVNAIWRMEPDLHRGHIIIVDDGAKEEAEKNCPNVTWMDGVKPFVFSRNANIGIRYAFDVQQVDGCFLLNDDALMLTRRGFTELAEKASRDQGIGLLSPACTNVGNRNQLSKGYQRIRVEPSMLCFICVYIPRHTWQVVGELDEQFTGYGFEDNDYSYRVRAKDLRLGIYDQVSVDHHTLKSTFRDSSYPIEGFRHNQRLFEEKHDVSR